MKTTLNKIRSFRPCESGWKKLLNHLNKRKADDKELSLLNILESNGLDDALWCLQSVEGYDKEKRLLIVKFVRSVQHLMTDQRSIDVLDLAEKYAHGQATYKELETAYLVAREAAREAARKSAEAVSVDVVLYEVAYEAAYAATHTAYTAVPNALAYKEKYAAVHSAAHDAAHTAAYSLNTVVAYEVAYAAARKQQEKDLREMLENCK